VEGGGRGSGTNPLAVQTTTAIPPTGQANRKGNLEPNGKSSGLENSSRKEKNSQKVYWGQELVRVEEVSKIPGKMGTAQLTRLSGGSKFVTAVRRKWPASFIEKVTLESGPGKSRRV